MSKKETGVVWVAVPAVGGVIFYLLVQTLMAFFVVDGALPERGIFILQLASGAVGAGIAGGLALKMTGWGLAPAASAVCMVVMILLLGLACYGGIVLGMDTILRASVILLGGGVVSLAAAGKKGKKRRKRMVAKHIG